MKVYELARELKMESKALLAKLNLWGIHAPSHMATLDERAVATVRQKMKKGSESPEPPKKPILIKKKSSSAPAEEPVATPQTQETAVEESPASSLPVEEESDEEKIVAKPSVPKETPSQEEPIKVQTPPASTVPPDLLPRIPVETWTEPLEVEKSARPSGAPLTAAEKEKALKERAGASEKKGKPVKGAKEKNQKLDRLHLLREEDFVDLDETGERDVATRQASPAAPAIKTVAPGLPPEVPPTSRPSFPRPAFKKATPFKKKGKGGG